MIPLPLRPPGSETGADTPRRRTPAEMIQEGSLYVLLLLLPFSKAAIEILFGFLFIGWLVARLDPRTRRDSLWLRSSLRPLAFAIMGYLAACALSIVVSSAPWLSLKGFFGKWVEYLLLFVIMADLGHRTGVWKRSLAVLTVSSLLVFMEAMTQLRFGRGLLRHYPLMMYGRVTGPYENPIDLATYLMVVLLCLLICPWRNSAGRALRWATLGALLWLIAATDAHGAWLAFCIGLIAMMSVVPSFRRQGFVVLLAALAAAAAALCASGHLKEALSWSEAGKMDRWMMWQAALGMIRDRPWLGHGVNTFMDNYLRYRVGGELWPRYAHNCYLQVAAETGVVGLAWFLGLLGALFTRLSKGLGRLEPERGLLLLGVFGGLVAFVVQSAYDTNFYAMRQAALFWVLAGLAVGLSERPQSMGSAGGQP